MYEGWKDTEKGKISRWVCPGCSDISDGYMIKDDSMYCVKCKKKFPKSMEKWIDVDCDYYQCKNCKRYLPIVREHLIFIFPAYMCVWCKNIVAIKYKNKFIQPQELFKVSWNGSIKKRANKVSDKLMFSECTTKKDRFVLNFFNLLAKGERTFFHSIPESTKAGLFFDKDKSLGYITWTKNKHLVLRQIYVTEKERKKGYGTEMIKYWIETIAKEQKFVVESPEDNLDRILIKLGYAEKKGKIIRYKKCYITHGM